MSDYAMKRAGELPKTFTMQPDERIGALFSVAEGTTTLTEPDMETPISMSDEVRNLVHEQALNEDSLRNQGYRSERASELSGRKFGPHWVRLALKGHNITGAMRTFAEKLPEGAPVRPIESDDTQRPSYQDGRSAAANDTNR